MSDDWFFFDVLVMFVQKIQTIDALTLRKLAGNPIAVNEIVSGQEEVAPV